MGSLEEAGAADPAHRTMSSAPATLAWTFEQDLREAEAEVDLLFGKNLSFHISMLNYINIDTCCMICKTYSLIPYLEPADRQQLDQIPSGHCWCESHNTNDKEQDDFFEALVEEPSPRRQRIQLAK